ncbi:TPA: Bax inhibitor 1, variant 2 [Trebouxia sp. C0004]
MSGIPCICASNSCVAMYDWKAVHQCNSTISTSSGHCCSPQSFALWSLCLPELCTQVALVCCNLKLRGFLNAKAICMLSRYGLLAGCALFQGATLGPLVKIVLATHPGILVTAFLGTSTIFACFSAAALLSRRRSWLYLGGALSSAMTVLLLMRLGSYFLGGRAFVFQAELYVGLLIFIGYVLFDTQVIVEKAEHGDTDHIKHALDLFVDFVAIFVRILVIMLQNAERKEERRDSRKNRR